MTDPLPRNTHKPNLKKLREIAKGLQGSEEPVQSEPLVPVSITREAFEKLLGWANFSDITISEAVIKHIDAPDSDSDTSSRANTEPGSKLASPDRMVDELDRITLYLRKELDKWDRVGLELKNGEEADFMAIDHILKVLPPVVATLIDKRCNAAYEQGMDDQRLLSDHDMEERCNEAVVKELKDMLEGFTLGFAKTNDPEFMEIMQPILNVLSDRIAELTTEQEKG